MASTKEFREFILEQLRELDDISCKPMMGEYLLYYQDTLFGGIYDDRLLVKEVKTNKKFNMPESIPYDGAKAMYLIEDVDDASTLKDIILVTYEGLKK